ncbi:UNVERIFIED_CONTAM: hypothetical protein NCL1_46744 [Trichonephila clavipes]
MIAMVITTNPTLIPIPTQEMIMAILTQEMIMAILTQGMIMGMDIQAMKMVTIIMVTNSHEKEDDLQQSQQGADLQQVSQVSDPVAEPVIVPSVARSHDSHPHHFHSSGSSSSFQPLPMLHHHHHHHDDPRRNRSRVVVMPKCTYFHL